MTAAHQPLVSVVIPCYNQGAYLHDAVASALRQTHPDVEVIVVDDGSTDDTASVVAGYPAARYVEQKNQGAPAARNAGLGASRGAFVVFLDADDRLLPQAAAAGIESLAAHPDWMFVTGHVRLIREDGSAAGVPPQHHGGPDPYVELLRSNYIWTPGAVMYRRSVFDSVGGFDTAAGGSADYELNIRIARSFPVGCHHQVILEYRQHSANMSADVSYMLKSAVSVRRSQRQHVRRNRTAEQAWHAGIDIVRADFGGRLIAQVKTDLRVPGRRVRALRGVLCLLRYYPAGVLKLMTAGVGRLLPTSR
jgi:glycosyltransferase involved in cell wall biosynthesis